jgi:hypothetical protein
MRFGYWAVRIYVCLLLMVSACAASAASLPAEVQMGLAWLKAQVQADGSVLGEAISIARQSQIRYQVLTTLHTLGEPISAEQAAPDSPPIRMMTARPWPSRYSVSNSWRAIPPSPSASFC